MHSSFDTPFEVKFVAETGVFEGYASVFHVVDKVNDQIMPGAFSDSLGQYKAEGRLPPLLWQHNTAEPIGVWREVYEDEHGLFVKGELFINDIPLAKEAYKLMRENVVTGLSIGYRTRQSHHDQKSGVRRLTQVDLLEVSLVTFPANEQARVLPGHRPFANGHVPPKRDCEIFLRSAGMSSNQAKGFIAQGYKALSDEHNSMQDDAALAALNQEILRATAEMKAALRTADDDNAEEIRRFNDLLIAATAEMKAGFNPAQARIPAGNAAGGQWSGNGGTSGGGKIKPAMRKKPLRAVKPQGLKPTPPQQRILKPVLPPKPDSGLPWGKIGAGAAVIGAGALAAYPPTRTAIIAAGATVARAVANPVNAARLRSYLAQARQIPKGVKEVGKGIESLTKEQLESLKRFKAKNTKHKNSVEITNFSDGSSIFTIKVPARDIKGSYRLYEKHISRDGKMIRTNAITVGPKQELVHIKLKGE